MLSSLFLVCVGDALSIISYIYSTYTENDGKYVSRAHTPLSLFMNQFHVAYQIFSIHIVKYGQIFPMV